MIESQMEATATAQPQSGQQHEDPDVQALMQYRAEQDRQNEASRASMAFAAEINPDIYAKTRHIGAITQQDPITIYRIPELAKGLQTALDADMIKPGTAVADIAQDPDKLIVMRDDLQAANKINSFTSDHALSGVFESRAADFIAADTPESFAAARERRYLDSINSVVKWRRSQTGSEDAAMVVELAARAAFGAAFAVESAGSFISDELSAIPGIGRVSDALTAGVWQARAMPNALVRWGADAVGREDIAATQARVVRELLRSSEMAKTKNKELSEPVQWVLEGVESVPSLLMFSGVGGRLAEAATARYLMSVGRRDMALALAMREGQAAMPGWMGIAQTGAFAAPVAAGMAGLSYHQEREKGAEFWPATMKAAIDFALEVGFEAVGGQHAARALTGAESFAWKKLAKDLPKEATTESLTQLGQNINEWTFTPEDKRKPFTEFLKDQPKEVLRAVFATVGMMGMQGMIMSAMDTKNAQTEMAADNLNTIAEAVKASKLNGRAPDVMNELLQKASKNEKVYIDEDKLADIAARHRIDMATISPAIAEQLQKDKTGIPAPMVEMTLGDLVTKFSSTPAWSELVDNIRRTSPQALTLNESRDQGVANAIINKTVGDMEQQVEAIRYEMDFNAARDDMYQKLNATRIYRPAVAKVQAEVYAHAMATAANRMGVTLEELTRTGFERDGHRFEPISVQVESDSYAPRVARHRLANDKPVDLTPKPEMFAREIEIDPIPVGTENIIAQTTGNKDVSPSATNDDYSSVYGNETVKESLTDQQHHQDVVDPNQGYRSTVIMKMEGKQKRFGVIVRLVEADTLNPAMSEDDNQFRNRLAAASQVQLDNMLHDFSPEYLGDVPFVDHGAPVLASPEQAEGKILAGNGRTATIKSLYRVGRAGDYVNYLRENTKFGNAVDQFKQPVMIRELVDNVDIEQFAIATNEGGKLEISALEQAKIDASRLGDLAHFSFNDNGELNIYSSMGAIRAWSERMPQESRGRVVATDGGLSQEGAKRLHNAIIYAAFGSSPAIGRMIESVDPGVRGVLTAIVRAAHVIADSNESIASGDMYDVGIATDIAVAIHKLNQARRDGIPVSSYDPKSQLIPDGTTEEQLMLLKFFDGNIRSFTKVTAMINDYYARVQKLGNPKQLTLFGGRPEPAKKDILAAAMRDANLVYQVQKTRAPMEQSAYHGTPYRFKRFSTEHVGAGEGAQMFGWGLYFADKKEIAEYYRDALGSGSFYYDDELVDNESTRMLAVEILWGQHGDKAAAIEDAKAFDDYQKIKNEIMALDFSKIKHGGQLYEVEIPDDGQYLLWDKSISEQPEKLKTFLESVKKDLEDGNVLDDYLERKNLDWEELTGRDLYEMISRGVMDDAIPSNGPGVERAAENGNFDKAASLYMKNEGIKGIKYLDATSRGKGEGSHNYVIFDERDVTIKNEFYQSALGSFDIESLTIRLGNDADLSTFNHELAHFFLHFYMKLAGMESAPQQLKDDMSSLLKMFGVADVQAWESLTVDEQRAHHEKFARGWEQYLFEGKAPSMETEGLFSTFKRWLARVYQSIKDFVSQHPEVQLSDEVRMVYDRMIATDRQIEMAQVARGMKPMFADAESAGMTEKQWAEYTALPAEARDKAEKELFARMVQDVKWLSDAKNRRLKEMQREGRQKYKEMREEVEAKIAASPLERMRKYIKTGKLVDAEGNAIEMPGSGKIGAQYVEGMPEKGALSRKGMLADDGVHPDELAAIMPEEFKDGKDLVAKMASPFTELSNIVREITDQRMLEKYGDRYTPERIEELADQAAHNEGRARVVATELKMLTRYTGSVTQLIKAAKDYAELTLRGTRFKHINPNKYASAAAIAGREALRQWDAHRSPETSRKTAYTATLNESTKAGMDQAQAEQKATEAGESAFKKAEAAQKGTPLERAAELKRQELVNHQMTTEAYRVRDRVRKLIHVMSRIGQYTDKDSAVKTRDMAVISAIREILAEWEIIGQAKGKKASDYLDVVREHDAATGEALDEIIRLSTAMANEADQFRTAKSDKRWELLRPSDIEDLAEQIFDLWHMAKNSKMIETMGRSVMIDDAVDELLASAVPHMTGKEIGKFHAATEQEKRGLILASGAMLFRRMESWISMLDGTKIGPWMRYIFSPVKEAETDYKKARGEYLEKLVKILDDLSPMLPQGKITTNPDTEMYVIDKDTGERVGYTFGGSYGNGLMEIMHAIQHTGNQSNRRKFILGMNRAYIPGKQSGRFFGDSLADGTPDMSRWKAFTDRLAQEGVLRKEHYDAAQKIWNLFEEMKLGAQKAHKAVFGTYFYEVTREGIDTPFGRYDGGYVPAKTDPTQVADRDIKDAEAFNQDFKLSMPTPPVGFTKSRVESYAAPLLLDLSSLAQHINDVLLFTHLAKPIDTARRIFNTPEIKEVIKRINPEAMTSMIIPWLEGTAMQRTMTVNPASHKWARVMSELRGRAQVLSMFANITNTLQQMTGPVTAAFAIGPGMTRKYFHHLKPHLLNHQQHIDDVISLSPYMRERWESQDREQMENLDKILKPQGLYGNAQEWTKRNAFFIQALFDEYLTSFTWTAVYQAYRDENQSATQEEAVEYADSIIRQTFGANDPSDISSIERTHPVLKLLVMFMSWANSQIQLVGNRWYQDVTRATGAKGKAKGIAFLLALGIVAPAIINELIVAIMSGGVDDKDKDGQLLDDWAWRIFGVGPLSYTAAIIPLGGNMATKAVNAWNDNPADDRLNVSPIISIAESAIKAGPSTYKAFEGTERPSKAIKSISDLLTMLTGLPFSALAKPVGAFADVAAGKSVAEQRKGGLGVAVQAVTGRIPPKE